MCSTFAKNAFFMPVANGIICDGRLNNTGALIHNKIVGEEQILLARNLWLQLSKYYAVEKSFIKTITMVVAHAREIFEIETGTPAGDKILSSLAPVISFTLKATPHSLSLVDVFEGCHDGGLIQKLHADGQYHIHASLV